MRRQWKKKMLSGVKPSFLFREALHDDPSLDSLDLDSIVGEEFLDLPQEITVIHFLWGWNKTGSKEGSGIDDEQLDELVMNRLLM